MAIVTSGGASLASCPTPTRCVARVQHMRHQRRVASAQHIGGCVASKVLPEPGRPGVLNFPRFSRFRGFQGVKTSGGGNPHNCVVFELTQESP